MQPLNGLGFRVQGFGGKEAYVCSTGFASAAARPTHFAELRGMQWYVCVPKQAASAFYRLPIFATVPWLSPRQDLNPEPDMLNLSPGVFKGEA